MRKKIINYIKKEHECLLSDIDIYSMPDNAGYFIYKVLGVHYQGNVSYIN